MGGYTKDEIRGVAVELGLAVADKPDSQEICFIPDNDYRRFVRERLDEEEGEVVDAAGRVLGTHKGVANYTIGQRQGLGLTTSERVYVTDIDPVQRRIVVGLRPDFFKSRLWWRMCTWCRAALSTCPRKPW